MNQFFSFSLYGNSSKYINGAIENCKLVNAICPEFRLVFFLGRSVTNAVETILQNYGAVIFRIDGNEDASAMFWRYKAPAILDAKEVHFRDCDSRISTREISALNEWRLSGKDFHIMRDHPSHNAWILGGLWGCKVNQRTQFLFSNLNYPTKGIYGDDQRFLAREFYPKIKKNIFVHDSFFKRECSHSFPTSRRNLEFVGEVFDENNVPDLNQRLYLKDVESSKYKKLRTLTLDWLYHKLKYDLKNH